MSGVFLSYSRADRALADQIIRGLRRLGVDVWWDEDMPGVDWQEELARQINELAAVVVLWTPLSVSSKNVKDEARLGQREEKLVNALCGVSAPPFPFDRTNGLPLDGWTGRENHGGWSRLVRTIEDHLVQVAGASHGELTAALEAVERAIQSKRMEIGLAEDAYQAAKADDESTAAAVAAATQAVDAAQEQLRRVVDMRGSPSLMRAAQTDLNAAFDERDQAEQARKKASAALAASSRAMARAKTELDREFDAEPVLPRIPPSPRRQPEVRPASRPPAESLAEPTTTKMRPGAAATEARGRSDDAPPPAVIEPPPGSSDQAIGAPDPAEPPPPAAAAEPVPAPPLDAPESLRQRETAAPPAVMNEPPAPALDETAVEPPAPAQEVEAAAKSPPARPPEAAAAVGQPHAAAPAAQPARPPTQPPAPPIAASVPLSTPIRLGARRRPAAPPDFSALLAWRPARADLSALMGWRATAVGAGAAAATVVLLLLLAHPHAPAAAAAVSGARAAAADAGGDAAPDPHISALAGHWSGNGAKCAGSPLKIVLAGDKQIKVTLLGSTLSGAIDGVQADGSVRTKWPDGVWTYAVTGQTLTMTPPTGPAMSYSRCNA